MKINILLTIPALTAAMTIHAQELKTYSGPFTIKKLDFRGFNGKATYTYRDAEDGTRIFHGEFNFENGWNQRIHGKFTDNKQTGIWIFNFNDDTTYTINFNNEGCPEGEISLTQTGNKWSYNIKDGIANGPVKISDRNTSYSYSLSNGVADGLYTETENGKIVSTGMFANGKPVGKWTFSDGICTAYFDDNGELKYVVDETTGDKSQYLNFRIPEPETPHPLEGCEPENFLMRDSKLKPETGADSVVDMSDDSVVDMSEIYEAVEQQAQFPGGQDALIKWLCYNLSYPKASAEKGVQGRVIVQFIVEKDGSISNPTVLRGVDEDLDKEALRIVKRMPKWQPGKKNGVAVRSKYTMPVTFKLAN